MTNPPAIRGGGVYDGTPDFVYAVSLLAALEGAAGRRGNRQTLAHLGMARSELVDFGQRRPSHYVQVEVVNFQAGMVELEQRLCTLLATSPDLQQSLRIEAARRLLRRGIAADR